MLTKAVILAAGRGTRMQSLTEETPKPMLPVQGRPILEHLIENLRQAGIHEFCIVTGYRAEQIESYFSSRPGIRFARQEVRDGTARAALLAKDFAGADDFLLTYGDILTEPGAYREMIRRLPGYEAVLAVKSVEDPYQGAAVYVEENCVVRIVEKPPKGTSLTHWNSAGIYCFRPSVFDYLEKAPLSPRGEYELTDAIVGMLKAGVPVTYYGIPGWWRDIGRPGDLTEADRALKTPNATPSG